MSKANKMKKLILISVAILVAFSFSNCNNKKKEEKVKMEQQVQASDSLIKMQAEFEKILTSYSSDECEFFEKFIKDKRFYLDINSKFIKIEPGELVISFGGQIYQGITSKTIYAVENGSLQFLPKGAIINDLFGGFTTIFEFNLEPLKSIWTWEELYPLAQKYELSIRAKHVWGNTPVLDWESYLQEKDYDATGFELDPKGSYVIWKKMNPTIMNQNGKCWLTREQSKARRNK